MSDLYELGVAAGDLDEAGVPVIGHLKTDSGWQTVDALTLPGGFMGACLDSRRAVGECLFVALPGTRTHGREFVGAVLDDGAVALSDAPPPVDAGRPGSVVLQAADPLAALTVLAGCWRRRLGLPIAGVTGSNGKTTTKDLLAAALSEAGPVYATRGNLNSAQGVPLSLLDLRSAHRLAVIEMGASAVGHIADRCQTVEPEVGVITNAADAHLEEFGSLERIIEGKGELVSALPEHGTAVLNADSPGFEAWCERTPARVVSWGAEAGDHRWSWQPGGFEAPGILHLDGVPWNVPLPGRHNGANLVAAILAARALGLDDQAIAAGLAVFRPSPHRAHLRRLARRLVLDDAYNANPASMVAAARMLCDLDGGLAVAVLGHMAELGGDSDPLHEQCGRELAALPLSLVVCVGPATAPLAQGVQDGGGAVVNCQDHAEAAAVVSTASKPGDRVLFKGSRSAAVEKVLDVLQTEHGWMEES